VRTGREEAERRRTHEFESFVGGAAGRLLHVAMLLTCEDASVADEMLCRALSRTYLNWNRLRGEDPYTYTRGELVAAYTRRAGTRWLHREPRGGRLSRLTAQERLVLVLRLFEGVDEEQTAAMLGMAPERVYALCTRAAATLRSRPPAGPEGPPAPRRAFGRQPVGAAGGKR
jgi:Sigma-70, region 4